MSILSDAMNKKITWATATTEAGKWFSQWVSKSPAAQALAGQVQSDFKQALSDAITVGDSLLGTVLAPAVATVEGTANAAILSAVGPLGATILTPAADHAIEMISSQLKAAVDAAATQARANLQAPATAKGS